MVASIYGAVESLSIDEWKSAEVEVSVLRLDSLHPMLSGNKYFKLKHNLSYIQAQGIDTVLSFGGAFSNHIHALAYAAHKYNVRSIGIIRGEPAYAGNPTLQDALRWGMELQFVSREEYKERYDIKYQRMLANKHGAFVIPEGGSNPLALQGCEEIVEHIHHALADQFDTVFVPSGTGSTLAGIAKALPLDKYVVGIAVLKGADYLERKITSMLYEAGCYKDNWAVLGDYHFGGYAKCNKALARFIRDFPLAIEPVYSAKMFWALDDLIKQGYFAKGSKIVAVHSGGMQGLRGMQPTLDKLLAS
ncbi:MAG: 1-aminocyclopropane-1-carboxylate deaminase [Pseudohongiellaceae bacterium]|jgi:1-aminocyclopropane-1-carboxylate deaminase